MTSELFPLSCVFSETPAFQDLPAKSEFPGVYESWSGITVNDWDKRRKLNHADPSESLKAGLSRLVISFDFVSNS